MNEIGLAAEPRFGALSIFCFVRSGGAAAMAGAAVPGNISVSEDGRGVLLSGYPVFPTGNRTSASTELPQEFIALGFVVEGGTAHESTARIRAIFAVSRPVRCALRSTGKAAT